MHAADSAAQAFAEHWAYVQHTHGHPELVRTLTETEVAEHDAFRDHVSAAGAQDRHYLARWTQALLALPDDVSSRTVYAAWSGYDRLTQAWDSPLSDWPLRQHPNLWSQRWEASGDHPVSGPQGRAMVAAAWRQAYPVELATKLIALHRQLDLDDPSPLAYHFDELHQRRTRTLLKALTDNTIPGIDAAFAHAWAPAWLWGLKGQRWGDDDDDARRLATTARYLTPDQWQTAADQGDLARWQARWRQAPATWAAWRAIELALQADPPGAEQPTRRRVRP